MADIDQQNTPPAMQPQNQSINRGPSIGRGSLVIMALALGIIVLAIGIYFLSSQHSTNGNGTGAPSLQQAVTTVAVTTVAATTVSSYPNCNGFTLSESAGASYVNGTCEWSGGQLDVQLGAGDPGSVRLQIVGQSNGVTYFSNVSESNCPAYYGSVNIPPGVYKIIEHDGTGGGAGACSDATIALSSTSGPTAATTTPQSSKSTATTTASQSGSSNYELSLSSIPNSQDYYVYSSSPSGYYATIILSKSPVTQINVPYNISSAVVLESSAQGAQNVYSLAKSNIEDGTAGISVTSTFSPGIGDMSAGFVGTYANGTVGTDIIFTEGSIFAGVTLRQNAGSTSTSTAQSVAQQFAQQIG